MTKPELPATESIKINTFSTSFKRRLRNTIEKFWENVEKTSACWIWKGRISPEGYGSFWLKGIIGAHRISWVIHHGHIPNGLWVLHSCDNPPCVNPSHLFLGTNADNTADKMRKGREVRGERINTSKLSPDNVKEIRSLIENGSTALDISKMFKVSRKNIYSIKHRKIWKHL